MKNVKFQFNYKQLLKLVFISAGTLVLLIPATNAQTRGAKPKFFICPKGMERSATIVTTKHDINLCGQPGKKVSVLAFRTTKKSKVTTLPLASSKHPVYSAVTTNGTNYTLDTEKKLLTITPKKGKASKEKVVRSD